MEWISVKDRLPDDSVNEVLTCEIETGEIRVTSLSNGWDDFRYYPWLTHWMLLPPPPKL